MNILDKLSDTPYNSNTLATLSYEDGCDVFHFMDDHIEEAVNETSTVSALAELATSVPSVSMEGSEYSLIEELKTETFLDTSVDEKELLKSAIKEKIKETFFEHDWVTCSTEHYDYKRGFTTVGTTVMVNLEDLKDLSEDDLRGWRIEVSTEHGTVILD